MSAEPHATSTLQPRDAQASPAAPEASAGAARARKGLWLGVLGVVIFAMTLPMTRLAVGPAADPQLPPLFVTAGRAALAGLLSVAFLRLTRAPLPRRRLWPTLLLCAAGTVIGFPLFVALALREVEAMHAAVVTGLLPLATAALAALTFRQRPSLGFWACALLGSALVLGFASLSSRTGLSLADALLLLAVLSAAIGYVAGARATSELTAEQVICWVLVLSLPLSLPLMLATWPQRPANAAAWGGFAYVTLFSMWLGFFAWYRGLALGGTVRVSQVQLLQPFLALLFAVPLLGEELEPRTLLFSLAIVGTVFVGRKMPAHRAREDAA
jgi:drug/metabolite transporter (DMT)-like permease